MSNRKMKAHCLTYHLREVCGYLNDPSADPRQVSEVLSKSSSKKLAFLTLVNLIKAKCNLRHVERITKVILWDCGIPGKVELEVEFLPGTPPEVKIAVLDALKEKTEA